MAIDAHLNGGPYDDQYRAVERDVFYVMRMQLLSILAVPSDLPELTITEPPGEYRMRRDAFGQPVPHNLYGCIEYDWQM